MIINEEGRDKKIIEKVKREKMDADSLQRSRDRKKLELESGRLKRFKDDYRDEGDKR